MPSRPNGWTDLDESCTTWKTMFWTMLLHYLIVKLWSLSLFLEGKLFLLLLARKCLQHALWQNLACMVKISVRWKFCYYHFCSTFDLFRVAFDPEWNRVSSSLYYTTQGFIICKLWFPCQCTEGPINWGLPVAPPCS